MAGILVPKDYRPFVKAAVEAGWQLKQPKKGHPRLVSPDGRVMVVLPSTSVSRRSVLNIRADLRRNGVSV